MLRIIAGSYKGFKIASPDTDKTRPTTDRVREAIMSSLQDSISNARVLDLFAGSGALGLESLSRGAEHVVFCDSSKKAYETIKSNLKHLNETNADVYLLDYEACLKRCAALNQKFDIVFVDPPYRMKDAYEITRNKLRELQLLAPHAILVEEADEDIKGEYGNSRYYKYGIVHVKITREVV